jgi:hypothetical protein
MSPAHDSANKKVLEAPAYSAVGGSLGCVFGFGALAIPEVGSFTAGMPMTTALLGAAAGAVGGWMIRWVFHWR